MTIYTFLLLAKCKLQISAHSPVHCDNDDGDDDTGDVNGDNDVEGDDNGFDWTEILDDVIVCILVN